jgi:hypothetical protein
MSFAEILLAVATALLLAGSVSACDSASKSARSGSEPRGDGPTAGSLAHLSAHAQMLAKWDHDGDFGPADNEVPNSPFDGDDDEVRYFGHRPSDADRGSIVALIGRYYAAMAADDGRSACSMIDVSLVKALLEQADGSRGSANGGCAEAMVKLFAHVPGHSPGDITATTVIGVRVRGGDGLALLRLRNSSTRDMPVVREKGTWKVEAFVDNGLA